MRLLFAFLLLTFYCQSFAQLYEEDFESFDAGDFIVASQNSNGPWFLWNNGADDAPISDEQALSGSNSLNIYGESNGGPMDIVLYTNLSGAWEIRFSILVPPGSCGYYSVQEGYWEINPSWAFECFLSSNGNLEFDVNNGENQLTSSYSPGTWLTISHHIDTDADLMNVFLDDSYIGQLPYDGASISSFNFYPTGFWEAGDPAYFIDDIWIDETSPVSAGGCTDILACNFAPGAIEDDGSCQYLDECGICGGSGVPLGLCDCQGNQFDALGVCGGACLEDDDNNGICDDSEVYGCTYAAATNYNADATRDDGSCLIPCVQEGCGFEYDGTGDGSVGAPDLLGLLSEFGQTTTDADGDGICDAIDDCVGEYDECGVCNGPGPTVPVIESIEILYDSVYAPQIDQWFVFEVGTDTTFSYTCAPYFDDCGYPISYQGYDYATVQIGDQCWFAENLRNENYRNGDAIPSNLSDSQWSSTTSGAVAVYGEGSSSCTSDSPDGDACDEAWSLNEYGRLYNWYAVDDARGLCPSGWHVPTDGEWTTMEMALGMSEAEANCTGSRGTDHGTQMKTDYGWFEGGNGTNSSGFSGLPGGGRSYYGSEDLAGISGFWWSSSPYGSSAWKRVMNKYVESVYRYYDYPRTGYSVRCIKDTE